MAIHLMRDYLTQNLTTSNRQYIYTYLLAIFLRRVLRYSYIGDTNFPINAIGSLLIATGDSNPTGTASWASNTKAGINIGTQKEFYVQIPIGARTVSGTDIGRILVLRSVANPTFNSGCFLIVGVDSVSNSYIIDYRTLGDKPPVEALDSLEWYIYEKDISCPAQGTPNSKIAGTYRGDGDSATPRIILQSPHALGWQVRICNESTQDYLTNIFNGSPGNCPAMTVTPGFGGTISGDFPAFGQHLHTPMWYNTGSINYTGTAPGFGDGGGTGVQFRITYVGDDTGQGVVCYGRRPNNLTLPHSNIVCFGLAENEANPLPVVSHARLFTVGSGFTGSDNFGSREVNDGSLLGNTTANFGSGFSAGCQGMSATTYGTPCVVSPSFWTYITGVNQGNSPIWDSLATDGPFTNTTEVVTIDLMQGFYDRWGGPNSNQALSIAPFAPRIMGTIPHIRAGRTNFGDFSPTTDPARSYQHLRRGLYIPWNGPNMIP